MVSVYFLLKKSFTIIFINESDQESEEHIKQVALQIEEYCKDVVVARKKGSAAVSCVAPASSSSHATSDREMDLPVGDECAMDLLDPAAVLAIQSGQQDEQFEEPIDFDTQMVLDETFEGMDLEVGQPIESCNGSDAERDFVWATICKISWAVVILLRVCRFQINQGFSSQRFPNR